MFLKTVIVLLFIGNLIALATALFTLMQDQGVESGRTAKWLMVRVSLAATLILTVSYGIWSGDLGISSPWHNP